MDFSERGRGEFVRITGSREYREVEQEQKELMKEE